VCGGWRTGAAGCEVHGPREHRDDRDIYTHLFDTDDHSGAMAALDTVEQTKLENVVPLWD
jgi:hypothetical protein